MAQVTSGYWHATEVFPPDVVAAVLAVIPSSSKVTFAPSHKQPTSSESQLPAALYQRCRGILDNNGIVKRRIVFFGFSREHHGGLSHAKVLHSLGFPLRVIADALAYNRITMKRWNFQEPTNKPTIDDSPAALDAGFKRCQELHPGNEFPPSYYRLVGSAILALDKPEVKKLVAAVKAKAQAQAAKMKKRY